MDSTQNFNNYPTQNFNPLFFMNANSYINQNNNTFNQINPMNQMNNNIIFNMNNFNPMNQMNNNNINFNINNNCNNNSNIQSINNNDNIIDLFSYIKEEKKIIKFINSNYQSNSIKIPISINKSDLYSIADKYKSHPSLNFILSYKNIMIKEDESSIEEIPEGAEINIIEERPIPNTCYYDSLKKKYGNDDIRNITFKKSGKQNVLQFPGEATLSEVKISYYNKFGVNGNMPFFIYKGETLKDNDERKIKYITQSPSFFIEIYDPKQMCDRKEFGKTIMGNLTAKIKVGEKEDIKNFKIEIGTLESTSRLYKKIDNVLCKEKKIKKLYLNNKEINKEDEESLKSLGIKEGFNVVAELENIFK